MNISIHSPYTGRDSSKILSGLPFWYFNPLSLYRERLDFFPFTIKVAYFNPLSLYRERRWNRTKNDTNEIISIHSPYTGRDVLVQHF